MNRFSPFLLVILFACYTQPKERSGDITIPSRPYLVVLGVAQDAGYPQAGCYKDHCMRAWHDHSLRRNATSLALIDPKSKRKWLFEASPDIKEQLFKLQAHAPDSAYELAGVFLTHGHMGHYTGLMQLGREVMNAEGVKLYAMPRMQEYLASNGPWDQLIKLKNVVIDPMNDSTTVPLGSNIQVTPFTVPHRDEYTETVGYRIATDDKNVIFIPDIDKWNKWTQDINEVVLANDHALLDATFFDQNELPGRDMNEIPHPFVTESMEQFSGLDLSQKAKIHFLHFNHSNPLLDPSSPAHRQVLDQGFQVAKEGMIISL